MVLAIVAHSEALSTYIVYITMGMGDRSTASGGNSYRAQD